MNPKKLNYKVSEFHHLFFNRALPEKSKAGTMAHYADGTIYHDANEPAAAFLSDVTATDGRPVAVIHPVCAGRWSVRDLEKAAPESVQVLTMPAVAAYRGPRTARALCTHYMQAIEHECLAAAYSPTDAAGDNPAGVPSKVQFYNALLALRWSDAGERENARAELAALLDKWQLAADGSYEKTIVAAISQRIKTERAASGKIEYLREYVAERNDAARKTGAARVRALIEVNDKYKRLLPDAIAAIVRAGLPAAVMLGLPANIPAMLAADIKSAARADKYLSAKYGLPRAWKRAIQGDLYGHDAPQCDTIPGYVRASLIEALEFSPRRARRVENKKRIANVAADIAVLRAAWPIAKQAADLLAAGVVLDWAALGADDSPLMASLPGRRNWRVLSFSGLAKDVFADASGAPGNGKNKAVQWPAEFPDAEFMDAVFSTLRADKSAYEQREKWTIEAAAFRKKLAGYASSMETMPRHVRNCAESMDYSTRAWCWNGAPERLLDALRAECADVRERAAALVDTVSAEAEFMAGGAAPDSGDWLRISGNTAKTTRGAEVPTRAIRAAFALLDTLPAGESVDLRPHGVKLGAFDLLRRESCGAVVVGCHTFSAASVANIREQLAAIESAAGGSADAAGGAA